MTLLHGCTHRLPWTKAERELGYHPPVDFATAVARTIAWLAFAGYPVRAEVQA
jgi:nucleoside-diphosphate-sugar epimerase